VGVVRYRLERDTGHVAARVLARAEVTSQYRAQDRIPMVCMTPENV